MQKTQRITIHSTAKIFCILHITLLPCVAPSSRPQSMVGNHRCRAALAVCIFVYTAGILLFSSTSWQRNPNRTCAHTELLSCSPVRLSINYMWGCLAENISALFSSILSFIIFSVNALANISSFLSKSCDFPRERGGYRLQPWMYGT